MKISRRLSSAVLFALISSLLFLNSLQSLPVSSLVYPGTDGKLDYDTYANEGQTNADNLIIDFSYAGYKGGGVPIPWVPVVIELSPLGGGDDYGRIQSAIDSIAVMPLSPSGFRGALLLKAGSYNVSETLTINDSGIIIRGEGQHSGGTIINFTATVQDNLFEFTGASGWTKISGSESAITDTFVPSGVRSFNVASSSGFSVGDRIIVHRTPNQAWIDLLNMAQYGWTPEGYMSQTPRTITSINGNTITIDVPTVHSIETQYGGGEIYRYQFDGAVQQVGIERLRLVSAYIAEDDEAHGWNAVKFSKVENGWARQITAEYFGYSCVSTVGGCQYVTVEDCAQLDPKSIITGGRRYSFYIDDSTYILFQRCYTTEGRHDYVTGSKTIGPNVFIDCIAENTHSDIEPHHRYAEGLLFDNVMGDKIKVQNRAHAGTGHGWAGAQTVLWNCEVTADIICDAPKAAMNFAIGCVGNKAEGAMVPAEPFGIWESHQVPVAPRSLYYKQLEDRLGTLSVLNATTSAQQAGTVWTDLSTWTGDSEAYNLPIFAPVQVDVGDDFQAVSGETYKLNAIVRYPLPENFPLTVSEWSIVSAPGTVALSTFSSQCTEVEFQDDGVYELQYTYTQIDDSDSQNIITYTDSDSVVITVMSESTYLDVTSFAALGTIDNSTSALSFNTDTLQMSGGLIGTGEIAYNLDGSEVAAFAFDDVDLTVQPMISGSRPFVLLSKNDLRVAADINVNGGGGGHAVHGIGVVGGGNGGDANRTDSPGNPYDGQGAGGSAGNSSGLEDNTSGGGGFGGAGGDGTGVGGATYGDEMITSLLGGSGAGGSKNKGGGAGGGALAFIAANNLEITSGTTLSATGGNGGSSGVQYTSGGGSGGGILLRADAVILNGTLNANGGNGGNASGGQVNGGGGGGGRIAVYYGSSLDTAGSDLTVNGGVPVGGDGTGKAGSNGSIYYEELSNAGPGGDIFDPDNYSAIGSISSATTSLTFDTDTLQLSGGLSGSGQLALNADNTEVAVFAFTDVDMGISPVITGSRPLVIISDYNLRIAASVNLNGSNGAHAVHGVGVAGGGNGGDANRAESPGNPYDGQGAGGSAGNSSGAEDSTSGGGGFGGAGGDATGLGGAVYGDKYLSSLLGGSGAGGTKNKGGGAGGGALALIAANNLEIASSSVINAKGGNGSSSGSQFTSGGGSGGGLRLQGKNVTINGSINVSGGNGGNASGGQLNGGGGSGGRIAIYFKSTLDLSGSSMLASGGVPVGANLSGQAGEEGSILYIKMLNSSLLDFENWKTIHNVTDDMGDDDNDGLLNFTEFALGGDPNSAVPADAGRPVVSRNGNNFDFQFRRNEASVTYVIEKSTDLVNWFPHAIDPGSVGGDVVLSVPDTEMADGKLFLRLRVEN